MRDVYGLRATSTTAQSAGDVPGGGGIGGDGGCGGFRLKIAPTRILSLYVGNKKPPTMNEIAQELCDIAS